MFDIDNNSYQNNPSTTSWSPFLYTRKAGWSLLILNIYHKTRSVLTPQTQIYITIKIKNLKILQHFWVMESIINRTENFVIYAMIIAKGQLS